MLYPIDQSKERGLPVSTIVGLLSHEPGSSILIKQPKDKKRQKQIKTKAKIYILRYELEEGLKST